MNDLDTGDGPLSGLDADWPDTRPAASTPSAPAEIGDRPSKPAQGSPLPTTEVVGCRGPAVVAVVDAPKP